MGFGFHHSRNLSPNLEISKFDFIVERKISDERHNDVQSNFSGNRCILVFPSQLNIIIMVYTRGTFF